MIRQTRVTLREHNRFTTAGEILQLKNRHPVTLACGDLAELTDHGDRAHLGLVGLFFQGSQTDRSQEAGRR